MKHRARDRSAASIPVSVSLLILAALSAAASGCSSSRAPVMPHPTKVVVLSLRTAADGGSELPDTTKTVTLPRGRTLAVQSTHSDGPGNWSETSAGNSSVTAPQGTVTTVPCPAHIVGCGATTQRIYLARSHGRSTIVWTYSGVGPGFPAPPSQPHIACSPGATTRCPVGVIRITVTVT